MKTVIYAIGFLMMFSYAFANDEPVPGGTHMTNLPEGSRILVKLNIDPKQKFGAFAMLEEAKNTIVSGTVWPVLLVNPHEGGSAWRIIFGFPPSYSHITFIGYNYPKTVAEFDAMVGSYFQIIYDDPISYDPYPGMDKSMVVDIVMAKITAALKANEYKKALKDFALLEKQGTPLPDSFYYYYTDALEKTGKKDEARAHAGAYLKKYGKKGKYYAQVIEIMSRL